MKKTLLTSLLFVGGCFFVYAQASIGGGSAKVVTTSSLVTGSNNALLGLLGLAQTLASRSVPLLIGVALLAFFWFLIGFIFKGKDDPAKQQSSLAGMKYSILALFVMVSIWGIIAFFGSLFGISQGGSMPGFRLPGE